MTVKKSGLPDNCPKWVNNKYLRTKTVLLVSVKLWHRIPRHRRELLAEVKSAIKKAYVCSNIKIGKIIEMR
jgi:hypothetical protein